MTSHAPEPAPVDVPRLLHALTVEPQPRLTWVSRSGERVELSGRVLVNWVAKSAHLLAVDCDLGAGGSLVTALGASWRAPVLWLAAWHLGAAAGTAGPAPDTAADPAGDAVGADVLVVAEGADVPGGSAGADVLVVPTSALAARADDARVATLGWVDYAAEVRLHPDELPPGAAGAAPAPSLAGGRRALLGPDAGPLDLLAVWADGGSVVWHDGLDPAALERLARQELAERA
ncbi:TIGR03089 family protein [Aquipuribacter nitratireducens]|uniref:TIGR03089 family protein n=1 Tax=Aquipuribacter nitratireducens TaxID=650104 RepID=A0ABW0GP21_9MICO